MLTQPVRPTGLIEILLPSGVSLRVDAKVDARALHRVLAALEARCSRCHPAYGSSSPAA
jgi:hypothetical protein